MSVGHQSVPLSLFERVAILADDLAGRLQALSAHDAVEECVILSTCHRVEVYLRTSDVERAALAARDLVLTADGVSWDMVDQAVVVRSEQETVQHLFAVTCGLESMVVGEEQIVAQVREAMLLAAEHNALGHVLGSLFRSALRVSKRARAETNLSHFGSSLVEVGVERAAESLHGLRGRTAVIIGAGRMGFRAGPLLRDAGVRKIVVTSRTARHATRLAEQVGGVDMAPAALPDVMGEADLVVSSTSSPGYVLSVEQTAAAMRSRPDRPLFLLDLAIPRDVDPAAAHVPAVTVMDLESLGDWLRSRGAPDGVEATRDIVSQGVTAFLAWRRANAASPVISALRAQAARLVDLEVERLHRRLPGLDQETRLETGMAVRRAVDKLLHIPTVRVKELSAGPNGSAYVEALTSLFDLDEPGIKR